MEKSKKRTITSLLFVFVLCLLIFLIHIFFGQIKYQSNDDETMNLIAVGMYGNEYSSYFVFSNIVYGKLVSLLFGLFPNINVYLYLMLALNFISIFLLCYLLGGELSKKIKIVKDSDGVFDKNRLLISFIVIVIFNFIFAGDFYNTLQFTKNAGLYTTTGICILYSWLKNGNKLKNLLWIVGIIFVVLGLCVRLDSFLAVSGVCAAIYISWLIFNFKQIDFKKYKSVIVVGMVLLASLGSCFLINQKSYSTTKWKEYSIYNKNRSYLIDFEVPDYEKYKKDYKKLGMSKNDITMFSWWMFDDSEKFTNKLYEDILKLRDDSNLTLRMDKDIIKTVVSSFETAIKTRIVCMFWVVGLILLIVLKNWKNLIMYILSTGAILFEYWYLLCKGRFMWRIEFLPWIGFVVFFSFVYIYNMKEKDMSELKFNITYKDKKRKKLTLATVVLFCSILVSMAALRFNFSSYNTTFENSFNKTENKQSKKAVFNKLNRRKEKFYILTIAAYGDTIVDNICDIDRSYKDYFYNITVTGGWSVRAPLRDETEKRYNIKSVLMSLIRKDNVYLVDNGGQSRKKILTYLEERTNRKIKVKRVEKINKDYIIYKYSYDD